jgi:hypothetical protein
MPLASSARKGAQPGLVIAISPTRDLAPFSFLSPASHRQRQFWAGRETKAHCAGITLCSTRTASAVGFHIRDRRDRSDLLEAKGAQNHADKGKRKTGMRSETGTQQRCVSRWSVVFGGVQTERICSTPRASQQGRSGQESQASTRPAHGYRAFGPPSLRRTRRQKGTSQGLPTSASHTHWPVPVSTHALCARRVPGLPFQPLGSIPSPIPTVRDGQLCFVCISAPAEQHCHAVTSLRRKEGKKKQEARSHILQCNNQTRGRQYRYRQPYMHETPDAEKKKFPRHNKTYAVRTYLGHTRTLLIIPIPPPPPARRNLKKPFHNPPFLILPPIP